MSLTTSSSAPPPWQQSDLSLCAQFYALADKSLAHVPTVTGAAAQCTGACGRCDGDDAAGPDGPGRDLRDGRPRHLAAPRLAELRALGRRVGPSRLLPGRAQGKAHRPLGHVRHQGHPALGCPHPRARRPFGRRLLQALASAPGAHAVATGRQGSTARAGRHGDLRHHAPLPAGLGRPDAPHRADDPPRLSRPDQRRHPGADRNAPPGRPGDVPGPASLPALHGRELRIGPRPVGGSPRPHHGGPRDHPARQRARRKGRRTGASTQTARTDQTVHRDQPRGPPSDPEPGGSLPLHLRASAAPALRVRGDDRLHLDPDATPRALPADVGRSRARGSPGVRDRRALGSARRPALLARLQGGLRGARRDSSARSTSRDS